MGKICNGEQLFARRRIAPKLEQQSGKDKAHLPSHWNDKKFLTTLIKTFQRVKQLLHQDGDLFRDWILFQKSAFSTDQTTKTAIEILPTLTGWETSQVEKKNDHQHSNRYCPIFILNLFFSQFLQIFQKVLEVQLETVFFILDFSSVDTCSREKGMNNVYFNAIRSF